jgi:hypothetical protein
VSWSPLELDREGYEEVAELLSGVLDKLNDIQARASVRLAEKAGKNKKHSTEVAIVHFERPKRARRGRPPKS